MSEQLTIDGVPVLHAPASGPYRAGLVFRVGQADETLARRGITHLVEHLALHATGIADYHYNGITGLTHTSFVSSGTPEQVAAYLAEVCAGLRDLSIDRLAVEKEILRAEERGRGGNSAMMVWRHGARDYGLPQYVENAGRLTEDDLRAWVARYFTRENAVLWVAGAAVPEGIKLDLPDGERRPAPVPSSALPVTPAWFAGDSPEVLWNGLVDDGPAGRILVALLDKRLARELSHEGGLAATTAATYAPYYGDVALICAHAGILPEKRRVLLGAFLDLLAGLTGGRITDAEVAALAETEAEDLRHAEREGDRLPRQAERLLAGEPLRSYEQELADLRAVTTADVVRAARQAYDSGLLRTPALEASWTGLAEAPWRSEKAVAGKSFRSKDGHARLIIGPDGVSSEHGVDVRTVRFADCAAVQCRADGGRVVIGYDAIAVVAEPTWYGEEAIRELDARVPAELRVDRPAAEADQIGTLGEPPRPHRRFWSTFRREARIYKFIARRFAGRLVIALIGAFFVYLGLLLAFGSHAYIPAVLFGGAGAYFLQSRLRRAWKIVHPLLAR